MRLNKIKLAGFKSFVDPTTFYLPGNLVGVVGPNGCGKSNVIDAVRWVMGESSPRYLRGESLSDVIFNGSSARKAVGRASIELVFDNADASLGGQYARYSEISIKRVLERDGGSHYYLNGTRCRRKDITEIFLGTGLGPRSYAIIEQGMISRLIEARPEELRALLEEAAGISRYRERRRETELRIRHTRDNLDRLADLREELARQLAHLDRQARTAERYKALREEQRRLQLERTALRWRDHDRRASELKTRWQALEVRHEQALATQRGVELALEKARNAADAGSDAVSRIQERYYAAGAEIARIEQEIEHARELRSRQERELEQLEQECSRVEGEVLRDRQSYDHAEHEVHRLKPTLSEVEAGEAEAREADRRAAAAEEAWRRQWEDRVEAVNQASRELETVQVRHGHLEDRIADADSRQRRLADERDKLDTRPVEDEQERLAATAREWKEQLDQRRAALAEISQRIQALRERLRATEDELADAREAWHAHQGRLASVKALQQAAMREGLGAGERWLEDHDLAAAPRLTQTIQVEPGWEQAAEAVLGADLEAVCLDRLDQVLADLPGVCGGHLTLYQADEAAAETRPGMLRSRLRGVPAGLADRLAGVRLAGDMAEALVIRAELRPGESVVTADGLWLGSDWAKVSRPAPEESTVLEREREIRALEATVESGAEVIESLQSRRRELEAQVWEQEAELSECQEELARSQRQNAALEADLRAVRQRLEHLRERRRNVDSELSELAGRRDQWKAELDESRRRLAALQAVAGSERERLAELEAQRDSVRRDKDVAREALNRLVERRQSLTVALESAKAAQQSGAEQYERGRRRIAALSARVAELRSQLSDGVDPDEQRRAELDQALSRRREVEAELTQARERLIAEQEAMQAFQRQRDEAQRAVQQSRDDLEEARLHFNEENVRREGLETELTAAGVDPAALAGSLDESARAQEWDGRINDLEQKLVRLEPINLAAIDEHRQQSERKGYLDRQHDDLSEALQTLEQAIARIDRESRAKFKATFDRLNEGLAHMFPRLFGGGHASLELTGDDLLEAGVTVMARPPGKRNSTIHLLSGGEKALTAVALVFAIFELNPAPFCMLDEVDAPLDDANVARFCELLREMSERVQFVFITHNKTTMELAGQLLGVTMKEPGVSRIVSVDVTEAANMAAG